MKTTTNLQNKIFFKQDVARKFIMSAQEITAGDYFPKKLTLVMFLGFLRRPQQFEITKMENSSNSVAFSENMNFTLRTYETVG